jgi:hypothetical protein
MSVLLEVVDSQSEPAIVDNSDLDELTKYVLPKRLVLSKMSICLPPFLVRWWRPGS